MSDEKELPPNLTEIGGGFYIVRTQAGFKKLIKQRSDDYTKEIDCYPTKYPVLVCVTEGYEGYWYHQVRAIHLNDLKKALEAQGELE